jgi:menaquinone-dependent protoporphyrinogen IX oxidase
MRARIVIIHSRSPVAVSEAAHSVAEVMERWGVVAEVRSVEELESLAEFDSAVVCGQMDASGWSDDAVEALRRHRRDLAHMSVAYLVGLRPELHVGRTDPEIRQALSYAVNWFNEIRPVRVGLFHLNRRDAMDDVRAWAQLLRANFVGPDLSAPSGIRAFLVSHPSERGDRS